MQIAMNQLIKGIQFFLVLKILMRENASAYSRATDGFTSSPFLSAQPYEGT
jgi:hypothetical protein